MNRSQLEEEDVFYIASNMREADRKEIYCARWNESPEELTDSAMAVPQFAWTFGLERPIAALGAVPILPGVWNVWMFATDEFSRIGLGITKFIMREMIPCLNNHSHRVETKSSAEHVSAHKWLRSLGATKECTLKDYGKNGEDFYIFRWEKPQIEQICQRSKKFNSK